MEAQYFFNCCDCGTYPINNGQHYQTLKASRGEWPYRKTISIKVGKNIKKKWGADCPKCGLVGYVRTVFHKAKSDGSLSKCDLRCTTATGHNCDCHCGGKNHGAEVFTCGVPA